MNWRPSSGSSAAGRASRIAGALSAALLTAGCWATRDTWHLPLLTRHERARIEDEARARHLTVDLTDPDPARREHASRRLAGLGPASRPHLHAAMRAGGPEEALAALELAEASNDQEAVAAALTYNPYAVVREAAAFQLGRWGAGAEALIGALEDGDPRVRAAAAGAIGDLRGDPGLRQACGDESPPVRTAAIGALVRLAPTDGRFFFMELWRRAGDDEGTELALASALARFPPLSDRRFVAGRAREASSERVRQAAASLLALSPDPGAGEP